MYLVGSLCRTDEIQNFFRKKEKILNVSFVVFGLLNGLVAYIFRTNPQTELIKSNTINASIFSS